MKKHFLLMTSALTAFALSSGAALAAADAAAAGANSADDATTIGEIVVTAEKREANLQSVPEAVTAFTSHDRDLKGISSVQDMTDFTPGLTYSSQLDRPVMRGLARSTNQYTADSSVAVYLDDFYTNSTFLVGRDDMLIDQVEVLLGPQGTLYGRNSIGGLINTISKRPSETLSGEVRVVEGNYGATKIEGTVTGPVPYIPNLTFRLSGYLDDQEQGYLTNTVAGQPTEGGVKHDPYGDFQLQYKTASDEIWFDTNVVGFNNDRGGPGSLLGTPTGGDYGTELTEYGTLNFNPNYPYGGGAVPGSVYYGGQNVPAGAALPGNPALNDPYSFAHATATTVNLNKAFAFQFHWTHHFDGFDVKYVTGYSQYHYQMQTPYFTNDNSGITSYQIAQSASSPYAGDPFVGPLTVNPEQIFGFSTQTDWFSHEITFSSNTDKPVQWIAGLYYYNETDNNPETDYVPNQPQVGSPVSEAGAAGAVYASLTGQPIPAGDLAPANPSQDEFLLDYQDRNQSAAAYAQVDWKITPTIKLTGGLRYTEDWKHATEEARYVDFSSNVSPGLTPQLLGSAMPAVDITTSEISFAPGTGICSLPTLQTSGQYAGDYARCLSYSSGALTGTAGIEWTPDNDTLVYARYNRGYKAFAFNAGYLSANTVAAPESVNDYEVGFKRSFNHNLTIDADAFYYDYTNDQVPLGIATGALTLTEFTNVPKAVSDGVEITGDWRPVRHLDLNLTYGFDHTEILSSCSNVGGVATGACYEDAVDPFAMAAGARPVGGATSAGTVLQSVQGDELPQAPENKVAFNANYTWVLDQGNFSLSATYIWKDVSYASIFTRTYDEAPSWSQVDMRAVWSADHGKYEVVAFVKNLFNTLGYDAAAAGYMTGTGNTISAANISQVSAYDLTPPRLYGMELHYKF
jgi:iron complex outermembrane receptor protein